MSYVDEVYQRVVDQNPAQPEFHQAVKEVLESLRVVIEANEEEYRKDALLNCRYQHFFLIFHFNNVDIIGTCQHNLL